MGVLFLQPRTCALTDSSSSSYQILRHFASHGPGANPHQKERKRRRELGAGKREGWHVLHTRSGPGIHYLESLNYITDNKYCPFFFLEVTGTLPSFLGKCLQYSSLNNHNFSLSRFFPSKNGVQLDQLTIQTIAPVLLFKTTTVLQQEKCFMHLVTQNMKTACTQGSRN